MAIRVAELIDAGPGRRAGMAPRPWRRGRTAKDVSSAGRYMALREAVVLHGPRSTGLIAS
jgi:hypothetical protein